jgi:hypothetical protein
VVQRRPLLYITCFDPSAAQIRHKTKNRTRDPYAGVRLGGRMNSVGRSPLGVEFVFDQRKAVAQSMLAPVLGPNPLLQARRVVLCPMHRKPRRSSPRHRTPTSRVAPEHGCRALSRPWQASAAPRVEAGGGVIPLEFLSVWISYPSPTVPSRARITSRLPGRHFGDVSPLRGMILGGAEHQLFMTVTMEPVRQEAD